VSAAAYTPAQLAQLWTRNGGSKATAALAVAVAMAESGGRADAQNHNTNGSTDRGLWQINSVHGSLSTFDPNANAKAAVAISHAGLDWTPWTTFKTGAYRKYLPGGAKAAAPAAAPTTGNVFDPTTGDKASSLKYAAIWTAAVITGLGIAGYGFNRALAGAPARAARAGSQRAAQAAVIA
jgi:hypothetical protein